MLLYRILIRFYILLLFIAAKLLRIPKALLWWDGRQQPLPNIVQDNRSKVWFHVSSLGEFEQIVPILEELKREGKWLVILTFFSPSGYEVKKKTSLADVVCYLPVDTPSKVKRFFEHFNPHIGVFVRYDFWWGYIHEMKRRGIPLYVTSLNLKQGSYLTKPHGAQFRELLFTAEHIFTLDSATEEKVNELGYVKTSICGDTRFDRVAMLQLEVPPFNELNSFREKYSTVLVCGSTWGQDEEVVLPMLNGLTDGLIIAPHEVDDQHIANIEKNLTVSSIRYSAIQNYSGEQAIIIDNIGLLSRLYSLGHIAYVGGAFKTGLHNILEPLSFGIPVIFGPNYEKFPEAIETQKLGFASSIATSHEFSNSYAMFKGSPPSKDEIRAYIAANQGGSEKILNLLFRDSR